MPCRDGREDCELQELRADRDALTRMLCDALKDNDDRGTGIPESCAEWWRMHKDRDAKRLREARVTGLAKFTEDEREALGVK